MGRALGGLSWYDEGMSAKRVLLTTVAGLVLASGAVFTTVVVMEESSARADENASQTEQVAVIAERNSTLTVENAALSERLDRCLATTDTYKGYMAEQQVMLRGIQDKWGKNYMMPIEDTFGMLQTATEQMECY